MDPHQFEAIAAISDIKNFYGSVDSIKNRKIFPKSKCKSQHEISREKQVVDQKFVEAGYYESTAELSGKA